MNLTTFNPAVAREILDKLHAKHTAVYDAGLCIDPSIAFLPEIEAAERYIRKGPAKELQVDHHYIPFKETSHPNNPREVLREFDKLLEKLERGTGQITMPTIKIDGKRTPWYGFVPRKMIVYLSLGHGIQETSYLDFKAGLDTIVDANNPTEYFEQLARENYQQDLSQFRHDRRMNSIRN